MQKIFVLLFTVAISPCWGDSVELKGADGKYKHHDIRVRTELLEIAESLRRNRMYDKAEKLYRPLIKNWHSKEYTESYFQACKGLFGLLVDSNQLDKYEQKTDICPSSLIRDEFLTLAWINSAKGRVALSEFLIPKWNSVSVFEDLSEICQIYSGSLLRTGESGNDEVLGLCSNDDLVKGVFYGARSMSGIDYLKSVEKYAVRVNRTKVVFFGKDNSAADAYLKNIKKWNESNLLKERDQACSEAVVVYLENDQVDDTVDTLESLGCSNAIIRRGFFRWAGMGEWRGDVKASIKSFNRIIDDWNRGGDVDGVRLACQNLYWLLVRSGDEDDLFKKSNACPDLGYSKNEWSLTQIPVVHTYLSATHDGSYRLVRGAPHKGKRKRLRGLVSVEFSISPEGKVLNPKVVYDSPKEPTEEQKRIDKAFLSVIKKMLYIPMLSDGVPVETPRVIEMFRF
ncbi:energy transducer TonB [Porticoccus sp. W117]|uniref:energy transducer TonB n=1 Tax=Porticoccus sp. W117 TaxID=3054777 RepID=UPI002592FA42|nr:energy transducer TonB [Porticoccus sp. W117]MDM3870708.1 energy transducer TonB [Porticoccus sp. W117]